MERPELIYIAKLAERGLCEPGKAVYGINDDTLSWTADLPECAVLGEVIHILGSGFILFSAIAEPYRSIIEYLALNTTRTGTIIPDDTETRTFLHEIPVAEDFTAEEIAGHLKKRKGVIIPGRGLVTTGMVTPEQAFVTFSSICFSCYVKFMSDCYYMSRGTKKISDSPERILHAALGAYRGLLDSIRSFPSVKGPFVSGDMTLNAIIEAGRLTVNSGMVDSYFGNISSLYNGCVYITQTGSSLDELAGLVDCCPMDGSSTCSITSSSEYSAHRGIYGLTDKKTVLHGHPRFSVIMSLLCDKYDCPEREMCHVSCPVKRCIEDIPVVPGEIGTGPRGLARTLPPAMKGRGAIVHGHGLFTAGMCDFTDAFSNLVDIEKMCFEKYFSLLIAR